MGVIKLRFGRKCDYGIASKLKARVVETRENDLGDVDYIFIESRCQRSLYIGLRVATWKSRSTD